jgi:predicted ArsR family transcriptional regulator
MEGMTIDEIAKALDITPQTAHKRLERVGIKPVSYKALYDPSAVEVIKVVNKGGRPPKAKPEAKGWTLAELSRELGIPENTVTQRLHVKGIDPLFRGAIYPPDTLDRIREAPMGRPPKKKDT